MVVSIDKATALRMYDKVQGYWAESENGAARTTGAVKRRQRPAQRDRRLAELRQRLQVL
jgi:type I restriction enzyme R subunit